MFLFNPCSYFVHLWLNCNNSRSGTPSSCCWCWFCCRCSFASSESRVSHLYVPSGVSSDSLHRYACSSTVLYGFCDTLRSPSCLATADWLRETTTAVLFLRFLDTSAYILWKYDSPAISPLHFSLFGRLECFFRPLENSGVCSVLNILSHDNQLELVKSLDKLLTENTGVIYYLRVTKSRKDNVLGEGQYATR